MNRSLANNNRDVKVLDDSGNPAFNTVIADQPIDVTATVTLGGAESPLITNLSLPTINTEVSHVLQNGLHEITIRNRTEAELKISYVSGESGTKYLTINANCVHTLEGLKFTGKTIYIQSPSISTVEILELYT
jgi:hypothetical protein